MFHHNTFIFNMIILEPISIIEIDEKNFSHEKLNNLTISLHRKDSFLWFALYFNQMNLVLVILDRSPAISDLEFLYIVLTLNLIHLLTSRKQSFVFQPSVKFDSISQSGSQMVRTQGNTSRFKRKTDIRNQLTSFLWRTTQNNNFSQWTQQSNKLVISTNESSSRKYVSIKHSITCRNTESISIGREDKRCNFTTSRRQIKSLLLYLLPVTQTYHLYLVLSS